MTPNTIRVRFARRPKAFRLGGAAPAAAAIPPGARPAPGEAPNAPPGVEAALRAHGDAQKKELALLQSLGAALRKETERIARIRAEAIRDLEARFLEIATLVCDSVLGERIERGDYRVASLLGPALATLAEHGVKSAEIAIRLHPADRVSLESAGDVPSLGPGVALVEDETVSRASCVVETPVGSVVSDVQEAFREAIARLRESAIRFDSGVPGAAAREAKP